MKKFYFTVLIVLLTVSATQAQNVRYTVRLKDKGSAYSLSQPSAYLSAKAIQRRINQEIPIDSTDLPVNPAYVDSISKVPGVTVLNLSKWMNQVLVETGDPAAITKINAFPFVLTSNVVSVKPDFLVNETISKNAETEAPPIPRRKAVSANNSRLETNNTSADTIDYGTNYPQVHIHEGEYLHKQGFLGQGITIAVLDAGFSNYKTNIAFDSLRLQNQIIGEYDFVMNEFSVNEDHSHGANVLSILASNMPGAMVGTAPKSNYWLFRTEDVASERPVEEQNWVAAAERADSAGADMISTSLGYTNFDNPAYNHTYAQRDGNTSLITIGADLAAKKGMIVMCSAGNSGAATDDNKYIMCPADGDSVMTVGAVNTNGDIAPFSCWGPNGAGKLKPNIVSVGWQTVYVNRLGVVSTGNGTSYSNPNIAGLIACLWQAFSEFNNMEILDAVERSADKYNTPDDHYGYGIPNFRIAYQILENKRTEKLNSPLKHSWITAFPVPFKQTFTLYFKAPASGNASMRLVDISGRVLQTKTMQVEQDAYYNVQMTPPVIGSGVYYLHYFDGKNKATVKLVSL